MGISPNNIIFSTTRVGNQQVTTQFTCGNITTSDIKRINSLKMFRLTRKEGSGPQTNIVSAYPTETPTIEAQDLVAAGATVQGEVISDRANNIFRASVTMTVPTVKLICQDVGQYACELNYENSAGVVVDPMSDTLNFTGYAKPDRVDLTGVPDIRRGGDGSEGYPFEMNVGDVTELTCNGRIGGGANAQLEWKKTVESGALMKLDPSSSMYIGRVNETRGPAIPVENECTNTRQTILRYTFTTNDQNVKGDIQFQCYIESLGANASSRFVYARVESAVGPTSTTKGVRDVCLCGTSDGDQKAAIAGGCMGVVIAILSAALVYILLRQRNCCKFKRNPTYETPQRSDDNTLNYDSLQQPGDNYELPIQSTPHT